MHRYVIYWKDGKTKEVFGDDFLDAWAHSGLSSVALVFFDYIAGPFDHQEQISAEGRRSYLHVPNGIPGIEIR